MSYELIAVSRTPAQTASHVLTELEGVPFKTIKWEDRLNGYGAATIAMNVDTIPSSVKNRLRQLDSQPLEFWINRDGVRVWSGPAVSWNIQKKILTLTGQSLMYYLTYGFHLTDETITDDLFNVARELVDDWEANDWADYGILTTGTSSSGTTATLVLEANRFPNTYQEMIKLSEREGGLDIYVDPTTRVLDLATTRGTDKTGSFIIDERVIQAERVDLTVASGLFGSDVRIQLTNTGIDTIIATTASSAVQAAFGKSIVVANLDGISDGTTGGDFADYVLNVASIASYTPNPSVRVAEDVDVDDVTPGDTVAYSYDAGLGLHTANYRMLAKTITLDEVGNETMALEFE